MNRIKPTKVTWSLFSGFLILNALLLVLGFLMENLDKPWLFFTLPVGSIGWLYILAGHMGVDVTKGSGVIAGPNGLGWMLLFISTSSSIYIYYIFSLVCSSFFKKRKDTPQRLKNIYN
jgi:hypothetical protein